MYRTALVKLSVVIVPKGVWIKLKLKLRQSENSAILLDFQLEDWQVNFIPLGELGWVFRFILYGK